MVAGPASCLSRGLVHVPPVYTVCHVHIVLLFDDIQGHFETSHALAVISTAMGLFVRQVTTLTLKNLLIAFVRRWFSTTIRAFILPLVFTGFLCVALALLVLDSD